MTMIEAIRSTLHDALSADERVILLGQDVGALGGVFRASEGLQARFGAHRVVDMPLAEASIVGAAIGLAVAGLRPVAELQFLSFAHQAFHQIGPQLARFRYRSSGRFPVPVVLRAPFGGNVRTPELHSEAIEAQFVQSPGLKVVMPATAADAKGLLNEALAGEDPVVFCEPLRGYRLVRDDVPDGPHRVPFGTARIARHGDDLTVVAWSAMVTTALRAAEALAAEDISVEVLDLRTLVPLDVAGLVASVERTGRCVVVHEAPLTAGFGAEVVATLVEECFYALEAPVVRVTAPDTPFPPGRLEEDYLPDVERVVRACRRTLELSA
jgi:pyruvate dehydrogenase E1 component beta subunit